MVAEQQTNCGSRAVEAGDAAEAAQHVAEMTAEDAAVGVEFVDDDVAEIFEEARPARVVREDAGVEHVGIGEDEVAFFTDGFAGVAGRVAIVGEDAEAIVEAGIEVVEFGELILRQGFGGEEVEGAGVGVFEDGVDDREVVAKGFAGGGGSDDDYIFFGVDGVCGFGLVGVGTGDSFCGVGGD